ncbi:MAG TPA: ATP-binding protein [Thermoanaerobaculia bacterium]|jgi:heavy metal sensor kinase|nr:ATP-binding protein [Thermoanaerobaculia bacterium]
MLRSIRGNLLGWYSAILLAVLFGFGSTLYHRLQRLTYERADAELARAAQLIGQRIEPGGEIPESLLQRFGSDEDEAAYAVLRMKDGTELLSAQASDDVPPPGVPLRAGHPRFRERGELREVMLPWGDGGTLIVGRSTAVEDTQVRHLVWILAGTGLGVLLMGLAGGWLLVDRALRPIATMSATAEAVSGSNLSHRIDLKETESELGPLARVLNRMLDRLEAAFEQQKSFTADASHELRTPLAVICSQAELALARERTGEEYRQALATCAKAAQRMRSLVDDLLVLARADAGMLSLQAAPFDLRACVEECAEMIRPLAAERGVAVGLDLEPVVWIGDRQRLSQVITNLLSNAIRYNRDGGRVDVRLAVEGPEVVLAVSDTGMGIAEEERALLFKRFHRVDKARSRDLGGSGLGLAICRSLVEAHAGTIGCESQPGVGSVFTVRLPTAPPPS